MTAEEKIAADRAKENEAQKSQAMMSDIMRFLQRIDNKLDEVLKK